MGLISKRSSAARHVIGSKRKTNSKKRSFMSASSDGENRGERTTTDVRTESRQVLARAQEFTWSGMLI
jgi:hypothetical protein